ncbi:polysaccharide biosynthesis protein [Metabacillus sp. GX 13764]|uniref:putative polysaccharide biosynthesis protein n=1 Tax=Metabacillus kandeliae TaxID=2900151 RepID=UPI001E407014|nr:polysaccharide biosynthesis protein [Metabacillus kandeliae]MCD7032683.1 polysaccharide biosynthesis protein [Metabacillus kandeliae]
MASKLMRGTFVLTLGTYISRLLGILFVIPFAELVGAPAAGLYNIGYTQYMIFLSIATAGFPMAVSKFVSRYNSLGDYETSRKMFRAGIGVMLLTGFLAFIALYLLAPFLAAGAIGKEKLASGITQEDATYVIRMVSAGLIAVPIMSLIRGFFQGHQSMGPTAVSQVVEQIARIAFLLISVYAIMKIYNGSVITAVGYATFGAFVGAIGGLAVLWFYWVKRRGTLEAMKENKVPPSEISMKKLFRELFSYALPFVFVGLAIPFSQAVDTFTMIPAITASGNKFADTIYGLVTFYGRQIIMIPISLATAFGLTLVPTITKYYTNREYRQMHLQINQSFQMIMFLVMPAIAGIMVLAGPIYTAFYKYSAEGVLLLQWQAPLALLFSLFTVNAAILQGINKQKLAVISLALGLLTKICLNYPLSFYLHGQGSIIGTSVSFLVSILYSFAMIKRHAKFSYKQLIKRSLFILLLTVFMALALSVLESVIGMAIDYKHGRGEASIVLVISVAAGAAVYLYLAHKSHLLDRLLGTRFSFLRRKKARSV